MAVLKLSEKIEVFKHAERQKMVGGVKDITDGRRERWRKRNDTQMERTGNDDY